MAVLTRKSKAPRSDSSSTSVGPVHSQRYLEAPDRGDQEHEVPERRPDGRLPEAPDAGEGRMAALEQEFTVGRSQS